MIGTFVGISQNLVPNPSFEDTISCPSNSGNNCPFSTLGSWDAIYFWTNPICSTSSDILNSCTFNSNIDVPTNFAGTQIPKTGNAYAGIYTGIHNPPGFSFNEYITSPLTQSLISGNIYCVSFYVSFSGFSTYTGTDGGLGALLSMGFPDTTGSGQANKILLSAQVNNNIGNVITNQTNWIQIWDTIIAQGGENYITIGNFTPDSLLNGDGGYYYIDDVEVKLCNDISVGEIREKPVFKVYPNPAENNVAIQSTGAFTGTISLMDIDGRTVLEQTVYHKTELIISISGMRPGYYFLKIAGRESVSTIPLIILR